MKKLIVTALCAIICLSMLAAIPALAADDTFTVEAEDVKVGVGSDTATFDVYFRDVTPLGLCAVKFYVTVEGGSFVEAAIGPDMPGSFMRGETGSETLSFLWVDISKGVYEETLAATFTVKLPDGLKKGDEVPVKITFDDDPDNYLSMQEDASGENTNLTPQGKDGKIIVVDAGEADVRQPVQATDTEGGADSADSQTDGTGTADATGSEETGAVSGRIDIGTEVGIVKSTATADDTTAESESGSGSGLPLGAKIGIAVGACAAIAAAVAAVVISAKKKKKTQ